MRVILIGLNIQLISQIMGIYYKQLMTESPVLTSLLIIIGIQVLFFSYAALKKTDTVTDLSYGLTFVLVALYLLITNAPVSTAVLLINGLIVIWGLRLGLFLVFRVRRLKRDQRFDGIREDLAKFSRFWLLQGISIWVILLNTISVTSSKALEVASPLTYLLMLIPLSGIIIESVADQQKSRFKEDPRNKERWTDSGLWKYSRHPNYLGEIIVWWGIFLVSLSLSTELLWTIISPVYITVILLFVTGLPTTEKKNDEKYKDNKEYLEYKKRTGLILPKLF